MEPRSDGLAARLDDVARERARRMILAALAKSRST
jgi:hypothetical protein